MRKYIFLVPDGKVRELNAEIEGLATRLGLDWRGIYVAAPNDLDTEELLKTLGLTKISLRGLLLKLTKGPPSLVVPN